MIVLGAGMAGLLAGAMLRDDCKSIIEKQDKLPDNHSAVLRFRTEKVSNALNIPFKEVSVLKAVHPWKNPIADAISYSHKNLGTYSLRSITSANGVSETRYIAPSDFINQMANQCKDKIQFNSDAMSVIKDKQWAGQEKEVVISTLPMPWLMNALEYKCEETFTGIDGYVITADIDNCNAYCSLYIPDPSISFSRVSITGNKLIIETPKKQDGIFPVDDDSYIKEALLLLGLQYHADYKNKQGRCQKFMKINPINEQVRKRFMLWASENYNIYSLGRFATWRPGLMMDDLVQDIQVIQKLANGQTNYNYKK